MSDMSASAGVAGRYAKALFELADEQSALGAVGKALGQIREALGVSADLSALIKSPVVARDEQAAAMAKVLEAMKIGAPVSNLVALMASKRRLYVLPQVIAGFNDLLAAKRGITSAEVVSAKPLTKAQKEALEATIKKTVGADIALEVTVDETLIGGLVVKVGSKMIDTSIRSKLASLHTAMKEVG
jgi:F-type H+-transporting ATPase subunit delta